MNIENQLKQIENSVSAIRKFHAHQSSATGIKVFTMDAIKTGLQELVSHGIQITDRALAMMYAIGMQESRLTHRFQIPLSSAINRKGPARGLWQFEAMGGVNGVLNHHTTKERAETFCRRFVGSINPHAVWSVLEYEDTLAVVFARLLLLSDPRPLPEATIDNEEAAWNYYINNWRPGKAHRQTWGGYWKEAINLL